MTLAELVAAVRGEHDASQAQVETWANQRYRRMVAESLWRMIERTVGTTVAGMSAYSVDVDMLDLRKLSVDGVEYGVVGVDQMWAARAGRGWLEGPGVFCAAFDTNGDPQVQLYPVPTEDGLVISGLMTFEPAALTSSDSPAIPAFLHPYWEDGVRADAYALLDGRWDLAEPHEARFELGIARLQRLKVSRIGGGAVQAQVQGFHFR